MWVGWRAGRSRFLSWLVLALRQGRLRIPWGLLGPRGPQQLPSSHRGVAHAYCGHHRFCMLFRGSLWRLMVAVGEEEEVSGGHPSCHSSQTFLSLNSTSLWQPWAELWQRKSAPLPGGGSVICSFCSALGDGLDCTTQPVRVLLPSVRWQLGTSA